MPGIPHFVYTPYANRVNLQQPGFDRRDLMPPSWIDLERRIFCNAARVFTFSVDNHSDASPIMKQIREAERTGSRVTLHYRQDLKSWWRCTPHEYFVTGVEK